MKSFLHSSILKNAFSKVISVIDKKASRPILSFAHLDFKKNEGLTILGSDGDISVKIIVPSNVEEEGQFCIKSKNFFEILKELPADFVELEILSFNTTLVPQAIKNSDFEWANLNLKCSTVEFVLPVVKGSEYPKGMMQIEEKQTIKNTIQGHLLAKILSKISHSIPSDEIKLQLFGLGLLIDQGEEFVALTTDGHRMSLFRHQALYKQSSGFEKGVVIPKKALSEIKKIAEDTGDENLEFWAIENTVYFSFQNQYLLMIRLTAKEFPLYKTVVPKELKYSLITNRAKLIEALKRVRIMAQGETKAIKFIINPEKDCIITSDVDSAIGKAKDIISVTYNGPPMEIALNAQYFLDALYVIESEDALIEFNNQYSALLVKDKENNAYFDLIMPMRL